MIGLLTPRVGQTVDSPRTPRFALSDLWKNNCTRVSRWKTSYRQHKFLPGPGTMRLWCCLGTERRYFLPRSEGTRMRRRNPEMVDVNNNRLKDGYWTAITVFNSFINRVKFLRKWRTGLKGQVPAVPSQTRNQQTDTVGTRFNRLVRMEAIRN